MQTFALALDLKDDETLIAEYEAYHKAVWPQILDSIKQSGITKLDIYRVSNRLFMLIEAMDSFTFQAKSAADAANPKVQEWETLMWNYQQALPTAKEGEKWLLMQKIFNL